MAQGTDRDKQVVFEVRRGREPQVRTGSWLEALLGIRKVPVRVRVEGKK